MSTKSKRPMTTRELRSIINAVISGIPELTTNEALIALGAPGTLAQGIAAAFEPFKETSRKKVLSLARAKRSYITSVPYKGMSTINGLVNAGKYDWTNSDVSDEHFPNSKMITETVRIQLVHFGCVISSEDIIAEFKKGRLRGINVAEVLSLGRDQPDLQRLYPIIALGQKWYFSKKDSFVVCLAWHGMLRRIYLLSRLRREWPAHCRFPAVSIAE